MLCIYVLAQSARRESLYFYYLPLWAFSAWEAPLILPCTYLLPISHLLTFVWSNLIMFIILIMLNNLTMLNCSPLSSLSLFASNPPCSCSLSYSVNLHRYSFHFHISPFLFDIVSLFLTFHLYATNILNFNHCMS